LYFWNSQGGGQEDNCPPRYTTLPDLRKGNASRCNIKRASPSYAPDNESVLLVMLDISKAYNCIDYKILLKKLENAGIRGNRLQ